jgi:hypothetical protein
MTDPYHNADGARIAHCPDPHCECPDEWCPICCACTCPPGWLLANFGWHRGPHGCPRYDIDVYRRARRPPESAGEEA